MAWRNLAKYNGRYLNGFSTTPCSYSGAPTIEIPLLGPDTILIRSPRKLMNSIINPQLIVHISPTIGLMSCGLMMLFISFLGERISMVSGPSSGISANNNSIWNMIKDLIYVTHAKYN
jgi:hypothetical protein